MINLRVGEAGDVENPGGVKLRCNCQSLEEEEPNGGWAGIAELTAHVELA